MALRVSRHSLGVEGLCKAASDRSIGMPLKDRKMTQGRSRAGPPWQGVGSGYGGAEVPETGGGRLRLS